MYAHNQQVRITQFILVQTGTYQEQTIRPFHTTIRAEDVNQLELATKGGRHLGTTAVQSVANNMLQLSAVPEAVATIKEGWTSRRFRFLMVVEERNPFMPNDRTQRIYFGYTDHSDASQNYLDPEMRIYFNSETIVSDMVRPSVNGPVVETMVVGSNQIISPLDMAGPGASAYHSAPASYMIRPEDIFYYGQTAHVVQKLQESGQVGDVTAQFDARAMVGQGGGYKYSNRKDTTPSRYISNTLTAYKHAVDEVAIAQQNDSVYDRELLLGEAQSYISNQSISSNPFFTALKDYAGYLEKGYVTLNELQSVFQEVARPESGVMMYSMDDGRSIRQVSTMEQSEHWKGNDNVTLAAATLAQVIPSIMMDNFIRSISFAATNGHGLGQFSIDFHDNTLRGVIDGLDWTRYLQEFERRLIFDALAPLTFNNQIGFQISMSTDLAGDSIIDIAIHGEPVRRYIAPTFTDSLFTPVITKDHQRQGTITNDLLYVMEQIVPSTVGHQAIITEPSTQQYAGTPEPQNQGFNYEDSGLL